MKIDTGMLPRLGDGSRISHALALVGNIRNAAEHHKKTCTDEDCNVSCYQLLLAARLIAKGVLPGEENEADRLMTDWPF